MSQNPPAAPAAPPPPGTARPSPTATIPTATPLVITSGLIERPQRIGIYGTGGIGKSTLAAWLPAPFFLDTDDGSDELNVSRDSDCKDWMTLRGKLATLATAPPGGVKTIVIDTATAAEKLAQEHVIKTRKNDNGQPVDTIEGFSWGSGMQYVAEEFDGLLADLDRCVAVGLNVCIIMHDVSSPVPNPSGEDFLRWEPHMYAGNKKGRGSIRERIKQWCDHLLFINYDVYVADGKGQGHGSRTIHSSELPTHMACSRRSQPPISFSPQDPAAIWRALRILPNPQ